MSVHDGWDAPRPGWVCRKCGFDYDEQEAGTTPALVQELGAAYRSKLLEEADTDVAVWRVRPDPATWSALEYACHLRDCFALYDWRIRKVLAEDRPRLLAMRRDDVVSERAYNDQPPIAVAEAVATNAGQLSSLLASITDEQWERVGIRDGEDLSVVWMARNVVHEAEHHLLDIDDVLAKVGGVQPLE